MGRAGGVIGITAASCMVFVAFAAPGSAVGYLFTATTAAVLWVWSVTELSTLLCYAGRACNLTAPFGCTPRYQIELDWFELFRVSGTLTNRYRAKAALGGVPLVVHVGPGNLDGTAGEHEKEVYLNMRGSGLPYHVVLAEPHPHVDVSRHRFVRHILARSPTFAHVTIDAVRAAVCERDGAASFFSINPQLAEEEAFAAPVRGLATESLLSLGSLSRNYTNRAVVAECERFGFSDRCESLAARVEELQVRCATPASLLREARVAAGAVDALLVDARGMDAKLVAMFFALDGFRPTYIKFLHSAAAFEEVAALVRELAMQGYELHHTENEVRGLLESDPVPPERRRILELEAAQAGL